MHSLVSPHLSLAAVPRVTTTAALAARHRPETDMEAEVAALLEKAGAHSARAVAEAEEALAMKVGGWVDGSLLNLTSCHTSWLRPSLSRRPAISRTGACVRNWTATLSGCPWIRPAVGPVRGGGARAAEPAGTHAGTAFLP